MKYLLIATGGAAGSLLRYFLVNSIQQRNTGLFPWGTFTVNITGSLVIGLLAGLLVNKEIGEEWRLFMFAGILGGFTTFSSLAIETFNLLRSGNYFTGIVYMFSSNLIGLLVALFGYIFARKIGAYT
jgi:CrcB protein